MPGKRGEDGGKGSRKGQKKENRYTHKTFKYVCCGFLSQVELILEDGCGVSHLRTNV